MNYLIYLAFGQTDIYSEALFSILSYQRLVPVYSDTTLLIYTDAPRVFKRILGEVAAIHYPEVRENEWKEWRGQANQVYMVKIAVLQHAATHFTGNLLLVDTDTIWQQDPSTLFQRIGEGERYLHADEGTLAAGNHLNRKIYRHLKGYTWPVLRREFAFAPTTRMYNSGVIGLRSSEKMLLAEVHQLAESFFATYTKHLMEQLAFSVCFDLAGPVNLVGNQVLHYWNLKEARPAITKVFTKYADQGNAEVLRRLDRLHIPVLHEEELAYRNLPSWRRTFRKLLGQRWRLPPLEV